VDRRSTTAEDRAAFRALGLTIKRLRKEKRLPRPALAEKAGISERWLIQIEAGAEAKWGELRHIAYALDVLPQDLIQASEID